ncbi:helix-hairpin-helix domain-containing protein [Salimicrobium flavidum]|uniref:Competence protein ComEA n=1 Tax=Salimicrobium flavidum TaxID=570947 RepID=A0A1N7II31_9BACI|nr:helix-hairpin-helix domain-containing protein [Salimicrobium flavidum]SIS36774.1 competence protein ComEA [Salimicrobium flavidum]
MSLIKKYWLVAVMVVLITVFLINSRTPDSGKVITNEEHELSTGIEASEEEPIIDNIVVDIKGAVHRPGIYEGSAGMRVHDIVTLAGGLTENADETSVNLAAKIQDEMVILVYSLQSDDHEGTSKVSGGQKGERVRINQASLDEITALNGIGPSKAEAIIAYREENGMFKEVEELLEVSGIGAKTLENMKDEIQIP